MATTYPAKQRKKQHELEDATYNCVSVRYLESVTESKAEPIEDIRRIVERWRVTGSERALVTLVAAVAEVGAVAAGRVAAGGTGARGGVRRVVGGGAADVRTA